MKNSRAAIAILAVAIAVTAVLIVIVRNRSRMAETSGQPGDARTGQLAPVVSSDIEMVLIPAGKFTMGSEGDIDTKPAHKVSVDAFYMDEHEVTQEVYEKIMGENPSRMVGEKDPVEQLTWLTATKFCNARSERDGLAPCYDMETRTCNFDADGYRLPTEAEWEYACRAGTVTDYYFGVDPGRLGRNGWFKDNSYDSHHPVKMKAPNAFGLYDMAGNVEEWCNDWYGVKYYQDSPESNPKGPDTGEKKVLRGGSGGALCERVAMK